MSTCWVWALCWVPRGYVGGERDPCARVVHSLLGKPKHVRLDTEKTRQCVVINQTSQQGKKLSKSPYGFSRKVKDTFFVFTINFIDLELLSMSANLPTWYNIHCSQCLDLITLNFNWSP